MVLVSLFKLEGQKVRVNEWLVSVWSARLGCYIVVDREQNSEVAGRQWCRRKRVSLSQGLDTLVSC